MAHYDVTEGEYDAAGARIAIVAARFNARFTDRLLEGALAALERHGAPEPDVVRVPGAFELPLAAKRLAAAGGVEAVVALGAVVRGETPHFEYVSQACARGLVQAGLDTGVPVVFGVLTTDGDAHAEARAGGGQGNKGEEAALAALEMVTLFRRLPAAPPGRGGGGASATTLRLGPSARSGRKAAAPSSPARAGRGDAPATARRPAAGARRNARAAAVQALYQWRLTDEDLGELESQFLADREEDGVTQALDLDFFHELLHGVAGAVETLDARIEPFLDRPAEQVNPIESTILRLGAFELIEHPEIPKGVVINEAIELAKTFGGENGHRYVNAVLDGLARTARPDDGGGGSGGGGEAAGARD